MGKPLVVFVASEERQFFRSEITRLSQVDRIKDWEVRLIPRDGSPIDAALSVAVVRNQEGSPVALRWLLRDITERKLALVGTERGCSANPLNNGCCPGKDCLC